MFLTIYLSGKEGPSFVFEGPLCSANGVLLVHISRVLFHCLFSISLFNAV